MLTIQEVKNAAPTAKPYKLFDGGGLFLHVAPSGARSWRLKYRFGGKEKLLTFGLYPEVKPAEARDRRDQARAMLRDGKDPAAEAERLKRVAAAAAGATFEAIARAWHGDEKPRWSPMQATKIMQALERDIFPALGRLPIAEIDGPMLLAELRKIERRGAIETAKRVRGYVLGVFDRAISDHILPGDDPKNPAERIGKSLKRSPVKAKHPALRTIPELLQLQRDVDGSSSGALTKLASRLLALTAARNGVLRTAPWAEFEGIDWDDPDAPAPNAIWRIPAARMKLDQHEKLQAAFDHDIPLPPQAVEILRVLRQLTGRVALAFPAETSTRRPMADATLPRLYRNLGYAGRHVPHGWRAAFSTIMNERAAGLRQKGDREIIDLMLAHVPEGMSASEYAYNRAQYADQRRELAEAWADLITADLDPPATVILGRTDKVLRYGYAR